MDSIIFCSCEQKMRSGGYRCRVWGWKGDGGDEKGGGSRLIVGVIVGMRKEGVQG